VVHGDLALGRDSQAVVVFAHGSGSSRHSPRNQYVASILQEARIATLLVDLLTVAEERVDQRTLQYRFDIGLLADRLIGVTDWILEHRSFAHLRLGYFGASTGAAAALVAAAQRPQSVDAIVSRGGRPDLAGQALARVGSPTLLIVGEHDYEVLLLNREAARQMRFPATIEIVKGATHLFEEPGALELVASLAQHWFCRNLVHKNAA
jgi:pimeloyl-ACP methyl ester carboxylesterase